MKNKPFERTPAPSDADEKHDDKEQKKQDQEKQGCRRESMGSLQKGLKCTSDEDIVRRRTA